MGANDDLIRAVFDCVNNRDFDRLATDFISPDFVFHDLADMWPGMAGSDGLNDFLSVLVTTAPDLRVEVESTIEEGDRVAVQFRLSGTHTGGPLFGVPPSGAPFATNGINLYRIANGRVAETWQLSDGLALYRALGLL